jgi:hypothetical protein
MHSRILRCDCRQVEMEDLSISIRAVGSLAFQWLEAMSART